MYAAVVVAIIAVHCAFLAWVTLGGLLVRRQHWRALHLASLVYACLVEALSLGCILTRAENAARLHAGWATYQGDFIGHYLPGFLAHRLSPPLLAAGTAALLLGYVWRQSFNPRSGSGRCASD